MNALIFICICSVSGILTQEVPTVSVSEHHESFILLECAMNGQDEPKLFCLGLPDTSSQPSLSVLGEITPQKGQITEEGSALLDIQVKHPDAILPQERSPCVSEAKKKQLCSCIGSLVNAIHTDKYLLTVFKGLWSKLKDIFWAPDTEAKQHLQGSDSEKCIQLERTPAKVNDAECKTLAAFKVIECMHRHITDDGKNNPKAGEESANGEESKEDKCKEEEEEKEDERKERGKSKEDKCKEEEEKEEERKGGESKKDKCKEEEEKEEERKALKAGIAAGTAAATAALLVIVLLAIWIYCRRRKHILNQTNTGTSTTENQADETIETCAVHLYSTIGTKEHKEETTDEKAVYSLLTPPEIRENPSIPYIEAENGTCSLLSPTEIVKEDPSITYTEVEAATYSLLTPPETKEGTSVTYTEVQLNE